MLSLDEVPGASLLLQNTTPEPKNDDRYNFANKTRYANSFWRNACQVSANKLSKIPDAEFTL